jgi:hypothetical protein
MTEDEKINETLENIKPVLGQEHDYFIHEKDRINSDLKKLTKPEERIDYLLKEYTLALDTLKVLKENNEKEYSVVDRLNSFSPGELAAEEVIKLLKEQISNFKRFSSMGTDNDNALALNGGEKLDLTEQLLLISYLQDGGHFIKRRSHQTEKNIQDLICLLLNKRYADLKSKVAIIREIKSGRITKGQQLSKVRNLRKIKDIFFIIGDKTTFEKIEGRIKELEKIS